MSRRRPRGRTEALQGLLFQAAFEGRADVVERLLARDDVEVNKAMTDYGATALLLASDNGHRALAELLLGSSASVDQTDKDGTTALMLASHCDIESALQAMVQGLVANRLLDSTPGCNPSGR